MIAQVRKGDLFTSDAQTLVNTVNTVGVMGKGTAWEFKRRFPIMFADYQQRCAAGQVRLGEPYLWRNPNGPSIVNFPTKQHWRSVSKLADIERGLDYLAEHLEAWDVTSLAVPALGAGNGGLDWSTVGPTLYHHLSCCRSRLRCARHWTFQTSKPAWSSSPGRHRSALAVGWLPARWS